MLTDSDTILKAQQQMNNAALELAKMANDVADAKTVKQYDGDRLKRVFSLAVAAFLKDGHSASAAEHYARAGEAYKTGQIDLMGQFRDAMRVIEKHDAMMVKYESARSILAVERAKIGI